MRGGSIAKRYATALLGVVGEMKQMDPVLQELELLNGTISQHPDLKVTFESPVAQPSQKKALFAELQKKVKVGDAVQNLLRILIDQNRVGILPILVLLYRDMIDEALGRIRVQVKVATELGPNEEKLKKILGKSLGKEVILESHVEPGLLGGLVVQVQDKVFDASLKRELEKIKAKVIEKAVA